MSLNSTLLDDSAYNKARTILADPRQAMRLALNKANQPTQSTPDRKSDNASTTLATHEGFQELVEGIRTLLPTYYEGEQLIHETQAFEYELARAEHAIQTGSSKGMRIDGRIDNGGANLYSPERMMLWYATMSHMEHSKVLGTEGDAPNITQLVSELAQSKGANYLFDKFAQHVTSILPSIGVNKNDCVIRWGEPNSHFWHMQKDPENGWHQDIINFDIKQSLLLGDHVQQVMMHELGHYLYDTQYPDTIETLQSEIKTIQSKATQPAGADTPPLSDDEQRALVRARYKQKLYHDVWNSAADNAVDESTHIISSGDNPKYRYALLPAFLTNFVTIRGQGMSIQGYDKEDESTLEKIAESAQNPEAMLNNLSNTLLMANSLKHGQMSSPEEREALLADLPQIGVYTQMLKNSSKPEMTGDKCFWDLYEKRTRIASLIPDPDLMSKPAEWRAARDEMQNERNNLHEEIFEHYAKPLIEQLMDKQKTMQEMIDAIIEAGGEGQNSGEGGIPINIPGKGGGQGNIPVFIPRSPGSDAPSKPSDAVGDEKTVGAHEKDAVNGQNSNNPEGPVKSGKTGTAIDGLPQSGSSSASAGKAAGKSTNAIADIELGDGRTLEQLRDDPLFEQAIEEVKERLYVMMENFAVPTSTIAARASKILPSGDPVSRLDKKAVEKYAISDKTKIPRLFKEDVVTHIPPVGDIIFALDTSGSMGWGQGSEAERVIKSTAIMSLAIQEFNEERALEGLSQMGSYVMLWGNGKPTFLGKPYDVDQQEEVFLKLDEVLKRVMNDEDIEGLHGGTELEGTFKALLDEYATYRPDSGEFSVTQARGPVLMMIGSDGQVFDANQVPLSDILQTMPSLTVDSMLTDGSGSSLHQALLRADRAEDYQEPVNIHINSNTQILPATLEWVESRMERFKEAIPWGEHHEVFTEGDVTEQAAEALSSFTEKGTAENLAVTGTNEASLQKRGRS